MKTWNYHFFTYKKALIITKHNFYVVKGMLSILLIGVRIFDTYLESFLTICSLTLKISVLVYSEINF